MQKQIRDLERKWSGFEEERTQLNAEQSEKFQLKTHLELSIRDLREEVEGERFSRVNRRTYEENLSEWFFSHLSFSAKRKMIYKV